MNQNPNSGMPGSPPQDIVMATEALFSDIAKESDAPLKEAVLMINNRRRLIRTYEAALIPDGDEELRVLIIT